MGRRLVVGLGNPGPEFERTWHNLGFRVVRALAGRIGASLRRKGEAQVGRGRYAGHDVFLLLPLTYMNRSGIAVARTARRYGLHEENILAVLDDHDLPRGLLRLRRGGGDGGHLGLRSVLRELGTPEVPRLRLGIRDETVNPRAGGYEDLAERVLEPLTEAEREHFEEIAKGAVQAVLDWIGGGIYLAMNRHNNQRIQPLTRGERRGDNREEPEEED